MSKRVCEITLRITLSEDNDDGWPDTWDWPSILDADGEREIVEMVRARRLDGKEKMLFNVGIREVHVTTFEIEAESPEAAMEIAKQRKGREVMSEYSHTLDPETWTVEKID